MKKDLLYISYSNMQSSAASSVHVYNICNSLSKYYNVSLFSLTNKDSSFDYHKYFGLKKNFKLINYNFFIFVKISFFINLFVTYIKTKPSLVVTRYPLAAYILLSLGAFVILDAHYKIWENKKSKIHNYIIKNLFNFYINKKNLLRIVTNSKALMNYLQSENSYFQRIRVAYNGSQLFSNNHFVKLINNKNFNIGYVGSVMKGRGIELVFELSKSLPQFTFHIIGGSEDDFRSLFNLECPSNLIFHGALEPGSTYLYRNSCNVLIAPYANSGVSVHGNAYEDSSSYMNPIKIFEYMSAKKPIIVSDIPVLHEILDEKTAIFCDYNKIDSWIDSLLNLFNNTELAKQLGDASFKKFINNYTWNHRAHKLVC